MNTTLITGGAGTLATAILGRYSDALGKIHIVDNFATGSRDNVMLSGDVTVHEGSVADALLIENVVSESKPDLILHLAASYKDPDNWIEDISTNIVGMANILKSAKKHNVEKVVNFQTVLCYGEQETFPIPDNAALRPKGSYAISKVAAEALLESSGVPFISIRLGSVISPGLSIGPIPNFYQQIKAGKKSVVTNTARDFLDVEDFLSFLELALQRKDRVGTYNLSNGVDVSIPKVYSIIANILGSELEAEVVDPGPDDVPRVTLDASRATSDFNWRPQVTLEESIERCLRAYDTAGGVKEIYSHLKTRTED